MIAIYILAALGAVQAAYIARTALRYRRFLRGAKFPPREWLERNGFKQDDRGEWTRRNVTVGPLLNGRDDQWAARCGSGLTCYSTTHPSGAVLSAIHDETKRLRALLLDLR